MNASALEKKIAAVTYFILKINFSIERIYIRSGEYLV